MAHPRCPLFRSSKVESISPPDSAQAADGSPPDPVRVAVGLVWKDGRLLIQQRSGGVHLSGFWEFPGGKLRPGEAPEQAVLREVAEETGIRVQVADPVPVIRYRYPEREVEIHPFVCRYLSGAPAPVAARMLRWVMPETLRGYRFPPANRELITALATGRYRLSGEEMAAGGG